MEISCYGLFKFVRVEEKTVLNSRRRILVGGESIGPG